MDIKKDINIEHIKNLAVEILPITDFIDVLSNSGKKLKVKLGIDPTHPNLHLGHSIVLQMMRHFQDLEHECFLVLGGFTALIGDPTGKNKTRPILSTQEVAENVKTYLSQAFKILKPGIKIVNNYDWLSKIDLLSFLKQISNVTVSQILSREDFKIRRKNEIPIGLHEIMYPILQGLDSVNLNADIEIGGTDQKFNMLLARDIQNSLNLKEQIIITTPIINGIDGVNKMSKSFANTINFTDEPEDIFGKVMSISDKVMFEWVSIFLPEPEYHDENIHRMILKKMLAFNITRRLTDEDSAKNAQENFEILFEKKSGQVDLPEITVNNAFIDILDLLKDQNIVKSKNEARNLLEAGAIRFNNEKIFNNKINMVFESPENVLKVGKKFFKIIKKYN